MWNNLDDNIEKINFEWLRYFLVLAETSNFNKAAHQLNITQQALSKALLNLEKQFRCKLIDRESKSLTEAGKLFIGKSKLILENLYELDEFPQQIKNDSPQGSVNIGFTYFWHNDLPGLISNLLKNFPQVFLNIYFYGNSKRVIKDVNDGKLDIGFIIELSEDNNIDYIKGPSFPFVIAGRPQTVKKWSELSYILINYLSVLTRSSRKISLDQKVNSWPEEKYRRKIIAEVNSVPLGIKLAEKGIGAIHVPEIIIKDELKEKKLAIIAKSPFNATYDQYIVWSKNKNINPVTYSFIKLLKKLLI